MLIQQTSCLYVKMEMYKNSFVKFFKVMNYKSEFNSRISGGGSQEGKGEESWEEGGGRSCKMICLLCFVYSFNVDSTCGEIDLAVTFLFRVYGLGHSHLACLGRDFIKDWRIWILLGSNFNFGEREHTNHFDTLIGVAKLRGQWSQFQQNNFVLALKLPLVNGFFF